jgi:hypothetical protein
MSSKKSGETKNMTISVSLTETQKSLFRSKSQGMPFSVVLRQLIQYSLQIERDIGKAAKKSVENLIACYERLPSSREALMGMKTAKTSVHLTERNYREFKELANNHVRRPANLLAILVDLFIQNVIPKENLW